ncbi:NAC domain-containing protein 2-like isoform X2 [Macadamia integrifolia]|uniref:NAC domain-containing protein 2-like isoform X2 n=1 Tax=Macadamia integrifolia TaxID=60698 RepID=UPI001C4E5659|nr:NAC domain-containing protein 2-like isoform X2 [Macadamia integrifolia]
MDRGKEVKVSIPDLPGVRFRPDDCEVLYFLKDKLLGRLELPPGLIQENIDPYIYDPMELPKGDGFKRDKKAFFFTNKKENQTTKDGFWGHTTTEHIFDHDHILGLKKELVFSWAIQNQIIKTNWVSHEYSISPAIFSDEERRSIGEKFLR